MNGRKMAVLLVAAIALVAAGCGGDSNNDASADTETTVVTDTTTSEDTTTTDSSATSTDATDIGDLSGECAQFAGISTKLAESISGQNADLESASKAFSEIADQVPDEIKADYEVIAKNFEKLAEALKGVDLTSGATPDAETLAKLQEVASSMDSAEVQQASQHIETWVTENC